MVVGLVGCGRWGKHILRDLIALGCEVPVVARSEASRGRAEEGGATGIVSQIEELPALDGAVVATTTSTHAAAIEGWVVHLEQNDRRFAFVGVLRIVLYDARSDSDTYGRLNVFHFGEHDRALVSIPAGVYHAVKNVGDREGAFVNLPSQPYRHENPDKYRLPLDNDVIPYRLTTG